MPFRHITPHFLKGQKRRSGTAVKDRREFVLLAVGGPIHRTPAIDRASPYQLARSVLGPLFQFLSKFLTLREYVFILLRGQPAAQEFDAQKEKVSLDHVMAAVAMDVV